MWVYEGIAFGFLQDCRHLYQRRCIDPRLASRETDFAG